MLAQQWLDHEGKLATSVGFLVNDKGIYSAWKTYTSKTGKREQYIIEFCSGALRRTHFEGNTNLILASKHIDATVFENSQIAAQSLSDFILEMMMAQDFKLLYPVHPMLVFQTPWKRLIKIQV